LLLITFGEVANSAAFMTAASSAVKTLVFIFFFEKIFSFSSSRESRGMQDPLTPSTTGSELVLSIDLRICSSDLTSYLANHFPLLYEAFLSAR